MNCKNCKHCLFDPLWGEYKCEIRQIILYVLMHADDCDDFSKSSSDKIRIAKGIEENI